MKKSSMGCAALCATLAIGAGTASAAQAKSFTVIGKETSGHRAGHGFIFNEKLYANGHQVGRDHVKITPDGQGFAVEALFRFHRGKIKVAGAVHRGNDQSVPIVGGRGRFHGIKGTFTTTNVGKNLDRETFRFSH